MSEHKKALVESFDRQARVYSSMAIASSAENVAPMVDLVMPGPMEEGLDLGSGVGFVCQVFSPFLKKMTGVDLSPEMVKVATDQAKKQGLANVEYRVADVENLPFGEESFDIVTSRFSFHHFEAPGKVLEEVRRVSRPMARIALYDMVSSPEDSKAALHNEIEKIRDPSHVRMLQDREWRALFKSSGLDVRAKVSVLMKREFERWMDVVDAPEELRKDVRGRMEKAAVNNAAGLGVRLRKGKISFTHTCAIWLLVRS